MKRAVDNHPTSLPPPKRNRNEEEGAGDSARNGDEKSVEEDFITQYQKEAIWRRMQEYKREVERAHEQIQEFERMRTDYDKRSSLFCASLAMVTEDLNLALGKLEGKVSSQGTVGDSQILDILKSFEETNEPRLDSLRRTVADQLSRIISLSMKGSLETEDARLMDSLNARCHKLATENAALHASVTAQLQRLKDMEEQLDDVKAARIVLERRLDRAKASSTPGKDMQIEPRESPDDSTSSTLAAMRMKEIEELKAERVDFLEKLDALKLQSVQSGITDDRIRESPLYQNLEAEFQFHRNENTLLKNRIDKLLVEYEEVISDRRKAAEKLNNDIAAKQKSFEAEVNGLKADLNRVRENRNNLQHTLELRSAKDEAELAQNQEIRMIANSRKDRITFLERRIEILKMKAASEMPGTFWIEFFNEKHDGNPFEELRKELSSAKERVKELEEALQASKQATVEQRRVEELLLSEKQLTEQVKALKARLQASEGNATVELEGKVKELSDKIEFLKKSEAHLCTEVDAISKAWSDVEERNMKKAVNLTEKEEQILRLVAEKTKIEQKCAMTSKHNNATSLLNVALKRQSEKQLEQIRKLEEREKSLVQQLQTIEKDFSTKTIAADLHRRKVGELSQKNAELTDRVEKMSIKYQEIDKLLRDKNRALVEESDGRRRLAEQLEVLRRKLDNQSKADHPVGEPSSSSSLQKEYEGLKMTLKCPSCRTNFWSHVLIRCKHVFCKNCIDDQINSRSRKCPSCFLAFSQSDVTKLYLP
ncbi:E3 ubiquitin-protein ligase bre1 [Dinochytrium kinnereticum]|nr:E3 ubiquitin-protein ligase bre1 [Dinochytrium kinnereticum]